MCSGPSIWRSGAIWFWSAKPDIVRFLDWCLWFRPFQYGDWEPFRLYLLACWSAKPDFVRFLGWCLWFRPSHICRLGDTWAIFIRGSGAPNRKLWGIWAHHQGSEVLCSGRVNTCTFRLASYNRHVNERNMDMGLWEVK